MAKDNTPQRDRCNNTVLVTCPHCVRTYTANFYDWAYCNRICEKCGDALAMPDAALRREYLKVKALLEQYKDDSFHYKVALLALNRAMRCAMRLLKVENNS